MVATSLRFIERFISLPKEKSDVQVAGRAFSRTFYDVKTVSDLLTRQGFEVEACSIRGEGFDSVVVGKIVSAEPHPNAGKLQVCRVDVGQGEPRQIVCGAPNARRDLFVAVALPGTLLPAPEGKTLEIKPSAIRGVESFGMLCSRAELGLPVNAAVDGTGIWELDVDGQCGKPAQTLQAALGTPVFDALGMRDAILELNVLSNRPDLRSHLGVARELEAGFQLNSIPFEKRNFSFGGSLAESNLVSMVDKTSSISMRGVELSARNSLGVGAFFILVDNIRVESSPGWMRDLLEGLGQNSVNSVVDASNLILLAYGHPSHAFDFEKLSFNKDSTTHKEIALRMASENEPFVGLDGKERTLATKDCVVADGCIPQAILGVIGGDRSKVEASTTSIVVEIANAHPVAVRRSSRRHGRLTESSMAFEKGIDTTSRFAAACELVALIETLSPTKPQIVGALHSRLEERTEEARSQIPEKFLQAKLGPAAAQGKSVDFSALARLPGHPMLENKVWREFVADLTKDHTHTLPADCQQKVLGAELVPPAKALEILTSLGFTISTGAAATVATVRSPHWRWQDIIGVPDLVEEIVRLVGIDQVLAVPLVSASVLTKDDAHTALFERAVDRATHLGYIEVAGFHFMREDELKKLGLGSINALGEPLALLNPIIRDEPLLHTTLLPDLLRKVARNIAYGTKNGQLCHLCRTFQNQNQNGERVFADNGSLVGLQGALNSKIPDRLFDYAPQASLAYSREADQNGRPAETPRLAGAAFGDKLTKSWQTTESVKWDLHSVIAHVVEICRVMGSRVKVVELPTNHPMAPALHPGRRVAVVSPSANGNDEILGWIAQVHPKTLRNYDIDVQVVAFELNLKLVRESAESSTQGAKRVILPRRFPSITRDFAFLLQETVSAERLLATVTERLGTLFASGGLPGKLAKIEIFDVYRGKNIPSDKKSVAIGITIEPLERTFNDAEIQKISQSVIEEVTQTLGGELRS